MAHLTTRIRKRTVFVFYNNRQIAAITFDRALLEEVNKDEHKRRV